MSDSAKNCLIVIRHSPYGSSMARAGLDTAFAFGAFEQAVSLLFVGDGVLQLLPGQDGGAAGAKDIARQLASLPLYDIEQVFVDAEAAGRYGLDLTAAPLPAIALDKAQMREIMAGSDHLLGF